MLMKVKDGVVSSMFHEGVKYYFDKGEIKDCPPNMLSAFRGVLVQAEPTARVIEIPRMLKMPIIQVNTEKIDKVDEKKVKKTTKKKKK